LNGENFFATTLNLWQNYAQTWSEMYNQFMRSYMDLTEGWLRSGTIAQLPQLNSAFGTASMVKGVDIMGANITGDKQITLYLKYNGNENSAPPIIIQAGAVRFNFDVYFSSIYKTPFKLSWLLSGNSKVNAEWKSPLEVVVELVGDTITLNDANIIGIGVHNQ
jgi:hypothetical protein